MIGILGGTFDPVHFGHLRPALEIAEQFSLDEVRFIPSARPPHRWQPVASAGHRLNMLKLAVQHTPGFVVDDREYKRKGSSYTVDTLQSIKDEIHAQRPLLMVLGQDAFQLFKQWHEWQKILELTHIVVLTRPGYSEKNHFETDDWMQGRVCESVKKLEKKSSGCIIFRQVTQLDISATMIRKQIVSGYSSRYLLPDSVVDYIRDHELYMAD